MDNIDEVLEGDVISRRGDNSCDVKKSASELDVVEAGMCSPEAIPLRVDRVLPRYSVMFI